MSQIGGGNKEVTQLRELTVELERHLDMIVLRLSGELDYECSESFNEYVSKIDLNDLKKVILNLEEVEWMDSSATGSVMNVCRIVCENRGQLLLCHVSGRVKKVLQLSKLDAILTICVSEKEAIRRLR